MRAWMWVVLMSMGCGPKPSDAAAGDTVKHEASRRGASKKPLPVEGSAPPVKPMRDEVAASADGDGVMALHDVLSDGRANSFFSPASLRGAIEMIRAGATGATARGLDQWLDRVPEVRPSRDAAGTTWVVANQVWGAERIAWKGSFEESLQSRTGARLERLDFQAEPESARATINAWVEKNTAGMIPQLFGPGSIQPSTALTVTSTVYFKGTWKTRFEAERTRDKIFRRLDGAEVQVPMMQARGPFSYDKQDDHAVLSLPYDNGGLSMVVWLPDEPAGLPELESTLSKAGLAGSVAALRPQDVVVQLPRFTSRSRYEIAEGLARLGLGDLTRPGDDLSPMADTRIVLDRFVHEAVVKVDEAGTEASAATGAVFRTTAMPVVQTPRFTVDRPFLFAIWDHQAGAPVFVGRIDDPTSAG